MKDNVLIGKTLTGIKVANDKEAILFQTTDGDLIVRVDADCCSHSWVESIELPALGFPALVTAAEDLGLNKPGVDTGDYEYLQFYGFKISTDRGEIVIDYRNSSNGYYGGSLCWPDDRGGVYGQNISNMEWVDVGSAAQNSGDAK